MSVPKKVYLFIGPPGSGKGTLSHLCVKDLQWVQLSTGNLCRKHVAEQTDIGKQIDFALKSGKLVSDSLITDVVKEWFVGAIQSADSIILDGYPRTLAQAQSFHEYFLEHKNQAQLMIVHFNIGDDLVLERICGRLVCQNRDCQKVYSLLEGSPCAPQEIMKCDVCCSQLGRRSDDLGASIKDRLIIYHQHKDELLNFYREQGYPIKEFIAEGHLPQVFDDFKKLIGITGI